MTFEQVVIVLLALAWVAIGWWALWRFLKVVGMPPDALLFLMAILIWGIMGPTAILMNKYLLPPEEGP